MKNSKDILKYKISAFFITMYAITLLNLLPIRPTYSESEKRNLAKFPKLSFSALLNGNFFHDIDTWFSDTFPLRDMWISGSTILKQFFGLSDEKIHGDIKVGDPIPDASEQTDSPKEIPTEPPPHKRKDNSNPDILVQEFDAVYIAGNSGYEIYTFLKDRADEYSNYVNLLSNRLDGISTLYEVIVPTSTAITLPDNIISKINSSDQEKAINYMYSKMNTHVKTVDAFGSLLDHRDEYIYFRTDHHWTALGAYYAYEAFAKVSGITHVPLSTFKTQEFSGFLGSFYTDTGKDPALAKNPDTVTAYIPSENATFTYRDKTGSDVNWKIIYDVTNYGENLKYLTFIGGDNSYSVIHNPDVPDNSACVIIKESFGNAFVPFLVPHYNTVHIIDYRYYQENLIDFIKSQNIKDVILMNNISATRNKSLVECIGDLVSR